MGLRIGIIGGNGWIGGAMARAAAGAGVVTAGDLSLSCRSAPPGWLPEAHWTSDNQALADRSEVVILSVRPQDWPAIRFSAPGRLAISVMAGVALGDIAARLGTRRVVRALPNAAAEVGASYTPWTATAEVSDADRATVRRLIDSFGSGDEVATEAEIDYMTGLSGTGPAYPALLASAMMRDAVAHGLPPDVARRSVVALAARGHRPPLREDGRESGEYRGGLRRVSGRHRCGDRDHAGARPRGGGLGGARRGAREVARP